MSRMTAAERRKQIIDVSKRLFSERGFNGVTTREIAEASSISEAMIFHLFASKRDLYTAIIDQRIQEVGEAIKDETLKSRDDEQVFGDLARYILENTAKDPTLMRLLYFSALEGHELSDIFYTSQEIKKVNKLASYIRSRMEEGAFRRMDPVIVARAFTSMLYTYVTAEHLFNASKYFPPASRETVIQHFLTIFLEGIRTR